MYNLQHLLRENVVDVYQLADECVLGVNDQFELSDQQRISFVENFSAIQLLPVIHKNTINLIGSEEKNKYLIWREKNGFFTALDVAGDIHTWSMLTGELIFEKRIDDAELADGLKEFKIYQSSESDD